MDVVTQNNRNNTTQVIGRDNNSTNAKTKYKF